MTFRPATSADTKPKSFKDVVTRQFKNWDLDKDERLTREEVEQIFSSIPCPADPAVAIGIIYTYFADHTNVSYVTQSELTNPQEQDTRKLELHFQLARERVQHVPHTLFARGAPSLKGMMQGQINDCYLIATLGSYVSKSPESIKDMFTTHADGSFDITFPGSTIKETFQRFPNNKQLTITSSNEEGYWLTALELAIGRKLNKSLAKKVKQGDAKKMRPVDRVGGGGHAKKVIQLLSGTKCVCIFPQRPSEWGIVKQWLFYTQGKAVATLGLKINGKPPPGLGEKHAYGILGYTPSTEVLHLWNPWAVDNEVKEGIPSWEKGYSVFRGHFWIPLSDLVDASKRNACVCHFDFQTADPLKPDTWMR